MLGCWIHSCRLIDVLVDVLVDVREHLLHIGRDLAHVGRRLGLTEGPNPELGGARRRRGGRVTVGGRRGGLRAGDGEREQGQGQQGHPAHRLLLGTRPPVSPAAGLPH